MISNVHQFVELDSYNVSNQPHPYVHPLRYLEVLDYFLDCSRVAELPLQMYLHQLALLFVFSMRFVDFLMHWLGMVYFF